MEASGRARGDPGRASGRVWRSSGGALGGSLYIDKLPTNRPSGRYVINIIGDADLNQRFHKIEIDNLHVGCVTWPNAKSSQVLSNIAHSGLVLSSSMESLCVPAFVGIPSTYNTKNTHSCRTIDYTIYYTGVDPKHEFCWETKPRSQTRNFEGAGSPTGKPSQEAKLGSQTRDFEGAGSGSPGANLPLGPRKST